jgi:hypothetical protein
MESMGISEDAVDMVKDIYQGASIVVMTPQGDTPPIPIEGRGIIQGDTLSPLLFIVYIESLLCWPQEDRRTYRMKTSNEEVGPLAYVDDRNMSFFYSAFVAYLLCASRKIFILFSVPTRRGLAFYSVQSLDFPSCIFTSVPLLGEGDVEEN